MHQYRNAQWVQKGWYLDMRDVNSSNRPESDSRFFRVRKQRTTNLRPVKYGTQISGPNGRTSTTLSSTNIGEEALEPDTKNMVYQCAVGLYNDFRFWMEHPSDYSMRQLDERLPQDNYDVGQVRIEESPYYEPNLEETGFWVVRSIADEPTFHARKEANGPIEPAIAVKVNKLLLEPASDSVASQLRSGSMRSTPVDHKVVSET